MCLSHVSSSSIIPTLSFHRPTRNFLLTLPLLLSSLFALLLLSLMFEHLWPLIRQGPFHQGSTAPSPIHPMLFCSSLSLHACTGFGALWGGSLSPCVYINIDVCIHIYLSISIYLSLLFTISSFSEFSFSLRIFPLVVTTMFVETSLPPLLSPQCCKGVEESERNETYMCCQIEKGKKDMEQTIESCNRAQLNTSRLSLLNLHSARSSQGGFTLSANVSLNFTHPISVPSFFDVLFSIPFTHCGFCLCFCLANTLSFTLFVVRLSFTPFLSLILKYIPHGSSPHSMSSMSLHTVYPAFSCRASRSLHVLSLHPQICNCQTIKREHPCFTRGARKHDNVEVTISQTYSTSPRFNISFEKALYLCPWPCSIKNGAKTVKVHIDKFHQVGCHRTSGSRGFA